MKIFSRSFRSKHQTLLPSNSLTFLLKLLAKIAKHSFTFLVVNFISVEVEIFPGCINKVDAL